MVYDCLMIEDEAPLAENTSKYLNPSGINAAAVFGQINGMIHNHCTGDSISYHERLCLCR
ncbi:hypothetical protein NSB25_20375 [Acetatifactor muris]|uniref:Uncharacterized protein n=1 Tax=Acetatifactor muris TaxID=879566 RepID=A0A2K4ZLR4_9FIRM|nr:hypothetical protein [Acetatifactor muris]MCR2049621.1 hypothetical protein [Acetatifactor muris]SOY31385.1 hypothetical protein AMURIS_04122 [Acetatifactor muris]